MAGLERLFLPDGLPQPTVALSPEAASRAANVAPAAAQPATTASASPASPAQTAPLPSWPAPWSKLTARLSVPPRVIITYTTLSQDLSGTADPGRRKLFQRVLAFLAWPQGTTLFWPFNFASGAETNGLFAADIFAQGVQHFGIRHVLCFGADAHARVTTMYPPELKDGPSVHNLPSPDSLMDMLPHDMQIALKHLRSLSLD